MLEFLFSAPAIALAIAMLVIGFLVGMHYTLKKERSKSDKEIKQLQYRIHELQVANQKLRESGIPQDKLEDLLTRINEIQTELETVLASAETVKATQHKLYELISEIEDTAEKVALVNDDSVNDIEYLVREVVNIRQRVLALRDPA